MGTLHVICLLVSLTFFVGVLSDFERTECGRQREGVNAPSINIVGGTEADPGEYPWQAALYRYGRRICGATVIHKDWIVTAAHCVDVINDPPIFSYLVGSNTLSNYNESIYHQFRETSEVHVHPNYRLDSNDFDIALMRMSKSFKWDDDGYVYPACVPSADMVDNFPPGSDSTITGWGAEEEGGPQSDELNEVTIPITNQTYCNESYGGSITDNMICAGIQDGGVDSCQGDSGGPMVAKNSEDGLWYLIGVVSWGTGCARPGYPGVYARVTTFADWIEPIFNGESPDGMPVGQCSDEDFQCSGGFCISKGWRCDGYNDCYHDTDELYCESALKPFEVYFDKRIDTELSDTYNDTFTNMDDCGLTCLNNDCHAFDAYIDDMNDTICIFADANFKIVNLTLEESEKLGITHFQRGSAVAPGSELTNPLGTVVTPAYTVGEYDEVKPGRLTYTMSINEDYYNHLTFTFIAIKSQGNASDFCADHTTQNLVVMRGVESDSAIVKCLNEIKLETNYEIDDEDAVLEFYTYDPQEWGFIVDYQASWYCDSVETSAPGFLVSPRYGIGNYPRNVKCHSLIQAPMWSTVRLEVEFFRIEFDGNDGLCSRDWDTLTIYDGPDDSTNLLGTYCGDTIDPVFHSTSNSLYVVFKSDSSAQETGYKLNFFFTEPNATEPTQEPASSREPQPTEQAVPVKDPQAQIDDLEREVKAYKSALSAIIVLGGIFCGVLIAAICTLSKKNSKVEEVEDGVTLVENGQVTNGDVKVNGGYISDGEVESVVENALKEEN